jgi:hypothetical protein
MSVPEVSFLGVLAEPNIVLCHDASEMYDYSYFIIVIEKSASRSYQLASKVLPSDDVDPLHECNIGSPSVTKCLLCQLV